MKRKAFATVFLLFLFIIAIFLIYNYLNLKEFTVQYSGELEPYKISIEKLNKDNTKTTLQNKIVKINTPIKLKKGEYIINFKGSDYASQFINLDLSQNNQVIILEPEYTDSKLSSLLPEEEENIKNVVKQRFLRNKSEYQISNMRLFILGNWAGVKIEKTSSDEQEYYQDVFRLVLKKENNQWLIVNEKPELIINSISYPEIPKSILKEINNNPEPN